MNRQTGIVHLRINGKSYQGKGSFKYNLGIPKQEELIASDGSHAGWKLVPQLPYMEGEIYESDQFNVVELQKMDNGIATLGLADNRQIVMRGCRYTGTGEINTEEGTLNFKIVGTDAEVVK